MEMKSALKKKGDFRTLELEIMVLLFIIGNLNNTIYFLQTMTKQIKIYIIFVENKICSCPPVKTCII